MLFSILLGGVLFIPGFLVCKLTRIQEYSFLKSIAVSCICFVVLVTVARSLSLTAINLAAIYLILIAGIVVAGVYSGRLRPSHVTPRFEETFSNTISPITLVVVLIFVGIYHGIFGVYDEIPADLYEHLNFSHDAFLRLGTEGFSRKITDILYVNRSQTIWYVLIAWVSILSGMEIIEIYPHTMIIAATLFMLAVAMCADRLLRAFSFSRLHHQAVVLLTVFFVFSQMGINVFAYVRYYSFAPSMINFVIYFAGLVCLLDLFEDRSSAVKSTIFLIVAIIASALIHLQESLFLIVACGLLLVWKCVGLVWQRIHQGLGSARWPVIVLILTILICAGGYIWLRLSLDVTPYYHEKVIHFSWPLFGHLYVLDPDYQFFRFLTVWGVLVYLLFFINFWYFRKQPFFIIGMLSPLLTVFNPFFVDLFMHTSNSTTLWRMCFFIPLHFVAGVLIIRLYALLSNGTILKKVSSLVSIGLLFVLLLPSLIIVPINSYAKTTLGKVAEQNRVALWRDLIEYLNETREKHHVLVDPVTGYIIDALTPHYTFQYKFLPAPGENLFNIVFDSYDDYPLSGYSGRLLVINNRDGSPSKTGNLSGHWPGDVMTVSQYYPDSLKLHLEANPDRFEKRWSRDGIAVYYIK